MICYNVWNATENRYEEIQLPDPVPLLTPDGALLLMGTFGISLLASVAMPVVPVAAIVGGVTGTLALDVGTAALYVLGAEAALAATAATSTGLTRLIWRMEKDHRNKIIARKSTNA